jgi:hypothetical protein
MRPFDIAPFALPRCAHGEIRFEEPREVAGLLVTYGSGVRRRPVVEYLQKNWPRVQPENGTDLANPAGFGWIASDDQWNGAWRRAATTAQPHGGALLVSFKPLSHDRLPEAPSGAEVAYRRTLGLRIVAPDPQSVRRVEVYTRSRPVRFLVTVRLDAGRHTAGKELALSAYNARIVSVHPIAGVTVRGSSLILGRITKRAFTVSLLCMIPSHPYSGDAAHLTFGLERDAFTIALDDLRKGPVWYAEQGIFCTRVDDATSFESYRARFREVRTTLGQISRQGEQSFAGPFLGQPRGHAVNYSLGCPYSPQRFWLEANGDLLLHRGNLDFFGRRPALARRMRVKGTARFFFGLEKWIACARYADPAHVPVYNIHLKHGSLKLEQTTLCVPLLRSILDGPLAYDEPTVALMRFRFTNKGDTQELARLCIAFSEDSHRSENFMLKGLPADDYRIPLSVRQKIRLAEGCITTTDGIQSILRAVYESSTREVDLTRHGSLCALERALAPEESWEVLLKVPYVALDEEEEIAALGRLQFDPCHRDVSLYWRAQSRRGAQLSTPEPHLDVVHAAHLSHVQFSDIAMPENRNLVNTSVGSSTYGNFANEACMILQELDQRGLAEEVERRLQVFVDFAGTASQPGNFTDFDGSFYGAGGWESGDYNQHHGWALWYLAEHYLLTGNRTWFEKVAPAVVAGADWVFRQRRTTMGDLPHSRGWERGFLPAGSLEDVTEFHYWLSTNCLTWRGTDSAARSLEMMGHPEAGRIRKESDAFRRDILRGLLLNRQHAPLVPLRDGRWVPHVPGRLYCRGRDVGWIRELLEGAIYMPISGIINSASREAAWILEDCQDNLYHSPPYGYVMRDPDTTLRNRGGFSIQPNLLAGLMPHLERDEIEVYLWMFFNAWAACYREEVDGMIEHPLPELGFHNPTTFKTSDEANAVMWLRAMMVYSTPDLLHLGRAMPRAWLRDGEEVRITAVRTHHGVVSARWLSELSQGGIVLEADLQPGPEPSRFLVRFRHPAAEEILSVAVNGDPWTRFDAVRGDVDITGLRGNLRIVASYRMPTE